MCVYWCGSPAIMLTTRGRVFRNEAYSKLHFLCFFFAGGGQRTARMASSNTVFRPRWVRAEHSRYLTAPEKRKNIAIG